MKKILLMNLCLLLITASRLFAQNQTVTGKVTAKEDGLPLPGVSVSVQGTTNGTQTDVNGKYSLSVPAGAKLSFSFLGYTTQTLAVNGTTLNVVLTTSAQQLGEVVVTGALGISRTRNQQSYAAQQVNGEEVSKQRSSNFIDGLSGKVSGLEIKQNNTLGGSTNVVIRGVKSIYGNNQALFVIDGVPVDNTNTNGSHGAGLGGAMAAQSTGGGGYDYGSPAADINPDDIESVTVLKGAGATALYGSRGSNGVILITTKKAKKGLGIVINSTFTDNSADKSTLPQYQTQYGEGYSTGFISAPNLFNDPNAQVAPTGDDASNGTAFNKNLKIYQWDAFVPGLANYGKATPWVAAANNPNSFFINSLSTNNSILVTNGGDNGTFKLGYTRSDDRDVVPGSYNQKNKIDFGATYNINSKLSVGANVNYTNQNNKTGEGTGYDGTNSDNRNVMTGFRQWWGLNNDIKELETAYYLHPNLNTTWNMADPASGNTGPAYWNNPYFVVLHNYSTASRNRYLGNVNATYKATDWLSFTGRVSLDSYSDFDEERYDKGSIGVPYYSRFNKDFHETNFDLYANVDKNLGSDFNLKGLLGTNIRKDYISTIEAETNNGLVIPGIYALSNTVSSPLPAIEGLQKSEVDGVFADATLSWKKLFSLEGTIRRDVSSTLPAGNNAYWYPSVSGGFIFSELLKNLNWLSYGKLRANYAEVGSDAPAYRVLDTYIISPPFDGNPVAVQNLTKNNASLRPERTRSAEGGLELDFLHGRLHFDGSYYVTKTVDQLIPVNVSTTTGYTSYFENAGTVQNKGVEISISGTPVATQNFNWKITVNWAANRNKVLNLFKDGTGNEAKDLLIASFQNGESINAPLGQPYGIIRGTDYTYDKQGRKVVDANGEYVINESQNNNIGNTNAKWTGGINNEFTFFKNFHASFLLDFRHGGDIFSNDLAYGLDDGLYKLTTYTNDLGNSVRAPLTNDSKSGGFIRPGVTATGQPNTVRVDGSAYGEWGNGQGKLPLKAFVYDGSFIKLREALIGYDLPSSVISKLGAVKGVTFQLIGHNLWIIHKNIPYSDPEDGLSAGNIQGIQEGSYPTVRTIAFNLKLRF
ncbi:MAG: SusC/RagA family TonB-linked outer membrane protein [Bacteroidota bacterium]|nr:SusC/RagA family TonB-linked outer membrane protein [Bacteroidota bacterium]